MKDLKEVLTILAGTEVPSDILREGITNASQLDEEHYDKLIDWCSINVRPSWATGLWMLDSAESCIETALENGNIKGA
jgi:hypothetical protein